MFDADTHVIGGSDLCIAFMLKSGTAILTLTHVALWWSHLAKDSLTADNVSHLTEAIREFKILISLHVPVCSFSSLVLL